MTNRVAVKLLTAPATNLAAKMPLQWVLKQSNGPEWVGEFARRTPRTRQPSDL